MADLNEDHAIGHRFRGFERHFGHQSGLTTAAGTHDAFCGASNEASNARRYGDGFNHGAHPNARDRLVLGAAKFGLARRDVHPCINWFKGVKIEADGTTTPQVGPFAPGRAFLAASRVERTWHGGDVSFVVEAGDLHGNQARAVERMTNLPRA